MSSELHRQRLMSAGHRVVRAAPVLALWLAVAVARAAGAPERVHYGGVYLYRFTLDRQDAAEDEARWQRLLRTPEVTYLCSQVSAPDPGEIVVRRVREAAAVGKRVVLQLWWGGSGRHNWSEYSLAHIAMDPGIRARFFAEVSDPLLDGVGAENVYGAHLLEETGMQFGVDLDVPGVPDDLSDGDDNGSNWDQPTWLGQGAVPGYIGGPHVPNIRRYNAQFRRDTGFDMRESAIWARTGGWPAYREWVSAKLEAGAMVAFADHLHDKYPTVRAFTWDSIDWGGAGANNMRAMKGRVDGLIMDPYTRAAGIYAAVRAPRLIDPDLEIIAVLWGQEDKPPGEMLNRAAAAYAGGANVICFFGDESHREAGTWSERVRQFAPFTKLPPFVPARSPVLLVTQHASWQDRLAGFSWFDIISGLEAGPVDLGRYDLVVLYGGATHAHVAEYVRDGGRVLTTAPLPFLFDEGLVRERKLATHPRREDIDYRPGQWWRQNMGLEEFYPLQLSRRRAYEPAGDDGRAEHAVLVPYGRGEVCLCQVPNGWHQSPPERRQGWPRLLADLARGLLLRAGRTDVAAVYDRRSGPGYLRFPESGGRRVVHCVTGAGAAPLRLRGRNLLGPDAPVLGGNCRTAIVEAK